MNRNLLEVLPFDENFVVMEWSPNKHAGWIVGEFYFRADAVAFARSYAELHCRELELPSAQILRFPSGEQL